MSWSCSSSVPKDGVLRGTRRNCVNGRRGPTNLTATPLLTRPISGLMSLHRRLLYAHRQLRLQQGNPSTFSQLGFVERLHDIARFVGIVDLIRNSYRDIGEKWASQVSIADDRYLTTQPQMLLAISLTRAIESGTIVASPAVRVGMHLALPLPQLQGGNRGIFPTSLQYHGDSLWLSCG